MTADPSYPMAMDRRLFLTDLSRYAALAAVVPNVWRVTTRPRPENA